MMDSVYRQVTSPTWGPPPPCKQALKGYNDRVRCLNFDIFQLVQVSWSVRESNFRDEVEASQGIITFSSGVRETDLVIRLRDDNVSRYLIILHLLSFIISFNRPFARWRHFTSTTRILFVFFFYI